jgi:hypothetical protein
VKEFAGGDDAWPDAGATMQNITALWDMEYLKDCFQEELERRKTALFEQDWKLAEMEAARRVSTAVEHYTVCRSARCRRARRCVGNKALCKRASESELKPAELQRLVERLYIRIQQERRAAAYEGRPPCVTAAATSYHGQIDWALCVDAPRRNSLRRPANAGTTT